MIDGINAVLERQREYHPSFVLMGGGFERSLLPWGTIPNSERVGAIDGGEELPLSECFRRSWEGGQTHLFITGPGGVGKTVALLTFATEEGFLPRRTAAVYIPLYDLSQYADERRDCVDEYLRKTFSKRQLKAIDALSRESWERGPNIILLMDGYNEIPPERRRHVEAGVRKWATDRQGTQVVTTSRVPGLHGLAHTKLVTLRGLAEAEVAEYLRTRHPDVAIPEAGSPLARLLETPLMLRLYAGVEEYRRGTGDDHGRFRDSRTAGDLVWNYLQAELHACVGHKGKHSERDYAETLLLTLPYVCWRMESVHEFKVDKGRLGEYVADAITRWEGGGRPEHVADVAGGPSPNDAGGSDATRAHLSILEGVSGIVAKRAGGDYSLAHQSLRDGLAAIHLLNVATAPHESLPAEFKRPISEYVKGLFADLLDEGRLLGLWEANRSTRPTDAVATNNLLRIAHNMRDGDLAQLDWSGMDLRGMSLFPFRRGLRLELSRRAEHFDGTRLDDGCFMPQGHSGFVTSVRFSPNGSLLASSSMDGTMRLWDAATGAPLRVLRGSGGHFCSIRFFPNGVTLACELRNGAVRLWDVNAGNPLWTLGGYQNLTSSFVFFKSVCFSPDGSTLAGGLDDGNVRLWDATTRTPLRTLEGHRSWRVYDVRFSPDGSTLAGCLEDGTVRLWDAATGTPLWTHDERRYWGAYSVHFSPDGSTLAGCFEGGIVRLWDAATGVPLRTQEGHRYWKADRVCFSPDGTILAGVLGTTVRLWDIATGNQLWMQEVSDQNVGTVCFSPDGFTLAGGLEDGTVRFWDTVGGAPLRTLGKHRSQVNSICFSPDGSTLASGLEDGIIRLWDAVTGIPLQSWEGHWHRVCSVCFSPDGSTLASGSWDGTVRLWDAATGTSLWARMGRPGWTVLSVCFSPDGSTIAGRLEDGTVQLWDAATGTQLQKLEGLDWAKCVCFSPDGSTLAGGFEDGTVRLLYAATGTQLQKLESLGWAKCVCFSPDGSTIAGGLKDGTVRLWDVATGTSLWSWMGHPDRSVDSICFSPDGSTIAGKLEDGTVRLWDAVNGRQTGVAIRIAGVTHDAVAYSRRGLHVADTGSGGIGIATWGPFVLRHPMVLSATRILYAGRLVMALIAMPMLLALTLVESILNVFAGESNVAQRIKVLRGRMRERLRVRDPEPTQIRDGRHLAWSYVSIIPLHDIDVTGLNFTKAKIDKRMRNILRKNGAKA